MKLTLPHIEAFLTLAEELHFGRTAERLYLSQPRVSRLIAALEREVGASLFERTSRRALLTPLGERLRERLLPAYGELLAAVDDARTTARQSAGVLHIGFALSTGGEQLNALVRAVKRAYPEIEVRLREISTSEPLDELRLGEVDVLVNWLVLDAPDLTLGPQLDEQDKVLMMAADHPLAERSSVHFDEVADYVLTDMPTLRRRNGDPLFFPLRSAAGRSVKLQPVRTLGEALLQVSLGKTVHVTVTSLRHLVARPDLVFVPIDDLPPAKLGLIWRTAYENARIRALAEVAASRRGPEPSTGAGG